MKKIVLAATLAAFAGISTSASAAVTIGGYNFADNAFIDSVTTFSGTYSTSGGSLSSVLTDTDPGTYAFSQSAGAFLDLAFTDNLAFNGAGNDIVLFELGTPDRWNVLINGITRQYTSASTGQDAGGFSLNSAALDLNDFGIGAGDTVSSLRLSFFNDGTTASTSLVGALNSRDVSASAVPEPATWTMLLLGFALIGGAMRSVKRPRKLVATAA